MRWEAQELEATDAAALPGLAKLHGLVRSVTTPEFAGITFHEVMSKSALNKVPAGGPMPFTWTVNPYRGCSHACVYCFARPSHQYLDLDSGRDFDTQVIVKINVAEQLRRELARPTWAGEPVALGTNTDPYQRAEGRYRLMPGIISALADSGTPFSILTKGTLLRRDLPLLTDAASSVPVSLAMSIAVFDDELQDAVEPGTPTATARLATVSAAAEAGFEVAVFMMPVLPFLTDSVEQLDAALARIRAAGATSVTYSALHLRPGVKEWFAQWLHRYRPQLVPKYRALYRDGAYAPKSYRRALAERIKPLIAAHGLARTEVMEGTGSPAVERANARDANGEWRARPAIASGLLEGVTLF
ncbi:MAG: Rv2578c family radical SAM protein [Demequina sp.]|nr:Rv2578c family radical SAM protein [Demequina sp.]